jgi:hypothetical protein
VKRGTASGNAFLWWLDGAGGEEKGRGSGLVMRGAGEGARGEVRRCIDWHGMGAVAPGPSNNGGRRTPRGRRGRAANRGGGGGAAADMWGRAMSGPVASSSV